MADMYFQALLMLPVACHHPSTHRATCSKLKYRHQKQGQAAGQCWGPSCLSLATQLWWQVDSQQPLSWTQLWWVANTALWPRSLARTTAQTPNCLAQLADQNTVLHREGVRRCSFSYGMVQEGVRGLTGRLGLIAASVSKFKSLRCLARQICLPWQ